MKNIPIILAIVFAFCGISNKTSAQCTPTTADVCGSVLSITGLPTSIDLCASSFTVTPSINLPSPLTLVNYNWSPAVTSHSTISTGGGVTVNTTITAPVAPTTYCLNATALGPNVIANGDFESGNNCFATGYTYDNITTPTPGLSFHYLLVNCYNIRTNFIPYTPTPIPVGYLGCSFGDATTGTGNMMIVNGSNTLPIRTAWQQNVDVCPGATYQFDMQCANWSRPDSPPILEVTINGGIVGTYTLTASCGSWQAVQFGWTNLSPATNVSIVIRDLSTAFASNDFVLDDLSLRRVSTAQACVNINPLPFPVFTLTPSVSTVCSGTPFTITSSFAGGGCPGCTMIWGGGATGMSGDPISVTEFTTLGLPHTGYYTYTVTNGFGCSATQSTTVNIDPPSDAGILRLPMPMGVTICSGFSSPISRLGGMPGGTWSTTAPVGVATVSPTGVVTFGTVLVPTTITVFYSVTSGVCPPDVASLDITVFPSPIFTITGTMVLCSGDFPTFCATPTAPTTGADWTTYAWSTGATTGPCIGLPAVFTTAGMAITESLTITNSFGCSASSTFVANVFPRPNPRIVVNPSPSPHLCVGDSTTIYGLPRYTFGTFVETWTSSNTSVATVTATGLSVASIVGVSPGTATITYTVTDPATGCSGFATFNITIYATPAPISGPSVICLGSSVTLSSTTPGGFWSSSDPVVADVVPDVSNDGIVTGLSLGTAIISYTLNHEHVKCPAIKVVTVVPTPRPRIKVNPSPSPFLCVGATTLIHGLPGYTGTYTEAWTSSDATIATVTPPSGSVATITAISPGTATITYTVTDPTTGCSGFATFLVTVYGVPMPISGVATVCQGSTTTLTSPTSGGVWSSNNTSIADVVPDAFGNGVVTGISGGTAVISYSLMHGPTSCGVAMVVTVIPMPTGVCPTWYNDPILGPVFVIGGTPTGATVTYDCLDPWGATLLSGGTTTTGSIVSSYPLGTITLCITSVTYMGCPFPVHCCVTFNGGSPKPAPSIANNEVKYHSSISVVPNPNKGTFTLSGMLENITGNDKVKIEVIDLLGKVVQTNECKQENGNFNKSITLDNTVANGVYIIKVTCGSENQIIRCSLSK